MEIKTGETEDEGVTSRDQKLLTPWAATHKPILALISDVGTITVKVVPLPLSSSHCYCLLLSPTSQFPTSASYLQNRRVDLLAKKSGRCSLQASSPPQYKGKYGKAGMELRPKRQITSTITVL